MKITRQIRHKDLLSRYDFVVVHIPGVGERECHPRDVKPGEIVELPVDDPEPSSLSDYAFFKVLPDLPSTPAAAVESLLSDNLTSDVNKARQLVASGMSSSDAIAKISSDARKVGRYVDWDELYQAMASHD